MATLRYAFGLSKLEVLNSEPPGTVKLIEHDLHRTTTGSHEVKEDHLRLVPTPTSSALDPLNWSSMRKCAILATMAYLAFSSDFAAGAVAPALPIMQYQILPPHGPPYALSKLSKLVSVNALIFGVSNIVWVPLSNSFGRRPVLIASMAIFVFTSMWCGLATSFKSLLAARAVQGLAGSTYSIAPQVIGEVFFVHTRGRAMAIYTVCLAAGPFVGGVSGAYIAGNLGYQYIFWVSTALAAWGLLMQIFLVPETLFDREQHLRREVESAQAGRAEEEKTAAASVERSNGQQTTHVKSLGFVRALGFGPYRGNLLRNFIAPWLSLRLPGTWMVLLQYGALVGGVVSISVIGPSILAAPPYLWGDKVGLFSLGGFVGAVIGGLLTFVLADFLVKWRAKKEQHGFSEPETRLPLMFPGVFLGTTGLWTFGFSAAHPSPHAWGGMVVGSAMQASALMILPSIGFNYLIDAYGAAAADCFTMTSIARSVVSFAFTYFIASWTFSVGPAEPFGIFGMLTAIFGMLALPLYLYGKRFRIVTADYLPKRPEL